MNLGADLTSLLPDELLVHLFAFFSAGDVLRAQRVSRRFFGLIRSNEDKMRQFRDVVVDIVGKERKSRFSLRPPNSVRPSRFIRVQVRGPTGQEEEVAEQEFNLTSVHNDIWEISFVTHQPFQQVLLAILNKVLKWFVFKRLEMYGIGMDQAVESFRLAHKVEEVTIHDCNFTCPSLLQALSQVKLKSLEFIGVPVRSNELSADFFKAPAIQELRALVRSFDFAQNILEWQLDDDVLQGLRNLETILLPVVYTQITAKSLKTILEEWRKDERRIKDVYLEIAPGDFENREEMLAYFHECEDCEDENHRMSNFAKTRQLQIDVANDTESRWTVEFQLCH